MSAPTLRCLAFAAALVVLAGASHAEEAPPCNIRFDGYVVVESNLTYSDVSSSYANAIYSDVRGIVAGHLSEWSSDWCFFREGSRDPGLEASVHARNELLELSCEVGRVSGKAFLSVRIVGRGTGDVLLSFQTSMPFFKPWLAVAELAEGFPRIFAGRVVGRDVAVSTPAEGFRSHDGDLYLGDIRYSKVLDFQEDLRRTEGVPRAVGQSARRYTFRRGLDLTAFGVGGIALLTLEILAMLSIHPEGEPPVIEVTPAVWAITGGCTLLGIAGAIDYFAGPPPRLIDALNTWQSSQ